MWLWLAIVVIVLEATGHAGAVVRGRVIDATTGAGVAGATVTADDGRSVETGPDGAFAIEGDTASIAVSASNFATSLMNIVAGNATLVSLSSSSAEGEEIRVSGEVPDTASPAAYALGRDQIRALPGGGNDVLRAVQTLPGVARVAYGLGGIVLRGASPGHNGVYVDGIEVPLAFHFGGVSSVYPSTLLDEVIVTPGGADVAFGGDTGGHVELRGRAPRDDRWRSGADIGVLDASAYAEGPAPGGGAVIVGLRRSYADAFLPALLPADRQVVPHYADGQLRWERGLLTVMTFFSDDRIIGWGGTDYRQSFVRAAVRWRQRLGATTVTVMPWAGWGRLRLDTIDVDPYVQRTQVDRAPVGLRSDLVRDTAWGDFAAGVDIGQALLRRSNTSEQDPGGDTEHNGSATDIGVWGELRWRIADGKLTLKPGLRADYFGAADRFVFDPRMVATHELAPWVTVREELGVYHQAPGGNSVNGEGVAVERAIHASVGARLELPAGVVASLTAFDAEVEGPPRASGVGPSGMLSTGLGIVLDNLVAEQFGGSEPGRRRSYGAELSAQRHTDRWMLWMAYTLARSERTDGASTREGWYPQWLDQTHNLNAVASVHFDRWQIGARFRWATGLVYTPLVSGTGDLNDSVWGPQNSSRLPDFVSLDFRLDRTWRRSWGSIGAFVDVQNVTNADNPEGINYKDGMAHLLRGLPVFPMVGVSYQPRD